MAAPRTDMHRLQELVRLHRLGTGVRERARLLGMNTRTERQYREALEAAALLHGDANDPPELDVLRAVVEVSRPPVEPVPVTTTVDGWEPVLRAAFDRGIGPQAAYDQLRRTEPEFAAPARPQGPAQGTAAP